MSKNLAEPSTQRFIAGHGYNIRNLIRRPSVSNAERVEFAAGEFDFSQGADPSITVGTGANVVGTTGDWAAGAGRIAITDESVFSINLPGGDQFNPVNTLAGGLYRVTVWFDWAGTAFTNMFNCAIYPAPTQAGGLLGYWTGPKVIPDAIWRSANWATGTYNHAPVIQNDNYYQAGPDDVTIEWGFVFYNNSGSSKTFASTGPTYGFEIVWLGLQTQVSPFAAEYP